MDKYLISLDLDGTLLNKKAKISFMSKRYLRKLASKGHVIIINTGRPLSGALKFYKSLKILKYPLSIINGASIVTLDTNDQIIHEESVVIDKNTFISFYKEVKDITEYAIAISNRKHYIYNLKTTPNFIIKYHSPKEENVIMGDFIDTFGDDELLACSFSINEMNKEAFETILKKEEYASFSFYTWGVTVDNPFYNFQLTNANHSKSQAMKAVQKQHGIQDEHVIAFGDSYNDIDMLDAAHIGVTMKNGREKMIKRAKILSIKDNSHNGVCHYLKKVIKL